MTDDSTTKPTIETVLERINALDQKFETRINELGQRLEARIDGVEKQVTALRSDMEAGFKHVGRKIEVLNDNFLTMQANQRDLNARVEGLESQGS